MKRTLTALLLCSAVFAFAGANFKLSFAEKKFAPQARSKTIVSKIAIADDNFIPIPGNKFAFVLSDKNAAAKVAPVYSAAVNFPFAAGSAEVTFKVIKREEKSQIRMIHVFAPAQKNDPQALLIYYMYIDNKGNGRTGIQVGNKQFLIQIPAKDFKPDAFNTIKLVWNADSLSAFLNGKSVEERALPPAFAKAAAAPRGWSTIAITPVYKGTGDNWNNRMAIASIDIKDAK